MQNINQLKTLFKVKDLYSFTLYPNLKEEVIINALLKDIKDYDLPKEVFNLLLEAWNSRFWVTHGYDGATIIKNKKHPAIANFLHDYMWRFGMGGYKSDFIYKKLLPITGYKNTTALKRFYIIRLAWLFHYKWKHIFKDNKLPISINVNNLYIKLKEHI